jgi:hypothetical protein
LGGDAPNTVSTQARVVFDAASAVRDTSDAAAPAPTSPISVDTRSRLWTPDERSIVAVSVASVVVAVVSEALLMVSSLQSGLSAVDERIVVGFGACWR